jgi:hypothetical protein
MRSLLSLAGLAAMLVVLGGCLYSFAGGGLPRHIRTVAILPFDNTTPQPLLETEVETRMQVELPRNLGVRVAAENVADAVVRGRITGYDEVAASVRPTGPQDRAPVVQRQVRITYEAEIYDMREDRPLWRVQGQAVTGNFQPESESVEQGRARAIQELVQRIIDGAQSQW